MTEEEYIRHLKEENQRMQEALEQIVKFGKRRDWFTGVALKGLGLNTKP